MVEQLTLNQRVGGSSPPRLTTCFQRVRIIRLLWNKKLCPILCHTRLKISATEVVHGTALRFHADVRIAVPAPVPYANPTNPQTLNLYAIVRDTAVDQCR